MSGRPVLDKRASVIHDLLSFSLTVEEIADKYEVSRRLVYSTAVESGLDMAVRTKIMRLYAKRQQVTEELDEQIRRYRSK